MNGARGLPSTVIFLAAFLAAEGLLVAAGGLGLRFPLGPSASSTGIALARAAFCLLLSFQVLARTRQGRSWTLLYLGVLVTGAVLSLLVLEPADWPDLALGARLQFLGALALRIALIAWLAGPAGRREFQT